MSFAIIFLLVKKLISINSAVLGGNFEVKYKFDQNHSKFFIILGEMLKALILEFILQLLGIYFLVSFFSERILRNK